MSSELKYYFSFGSQHINPETGESMKDYWVEVVMYDDKTNLTGMDISILKEKARQVMFKRYGRKWSMQYEENQFNEQYFPKGCYQKLYYPLPEDIEIKDENKFAVGDMVLPKFKDTTLDQYFNGEAKKVIRVVDMEGDTDIQFVYIIRGDGNVSFFSYDLKKVY